VWGDVIEASDAAQIVKAYLGLPEPVRQRMHLALTRFGRAKRRFELEVKALDLMIAVELLLTHKDDLGENTFKVALRAGLLTNGGDNERMRARAVFVALYRLRSSIVHAGAASATFNVGVFGSEPTEQMVAEGLKRTAAIMRARLLACSLPDWRKFDLGIE